MTKPTLTEAARRHASHYLAVLERLGAEDGRPAEDLAREWPQIRRAREWSAASPDAPARAALDRGFSRLGPHALALALAGARALGEGADEPPRNVVGPVGRAGGDVRLALSLLQWALALARQDGDRQGEAAALVDLGTTHHRLGEHDVAAAYFGRVLEIVRSLPDPEGIAAKEADRAARLAQAGEMEAALDRLAQALRVHPSQGGG